MSSVVTASGVSFELPNGRPLFQDLSFSVDRGLTALVGENGVGKTTLARLLSGELMPSRGTLSRTRPITVLAQREEPPGCTVAEHLATRYTWSPLGEQLLEGIDDAARDLPCAALSGGQWMRVRLACALDESFLILDEPSNDLDRDGRRAVQAFLASHRGGALLISHDRECLELCPVILELSAHGIARHGGGWSDYLDAREAERERLASALDVARRDRDRARLEQQRARERQERRSRSGARAAARGGMPKILLGARKARAQQTTGRIDRSTSDRLDAALRTAHQAFAELKADSVMYADLDSGPLPAQKLVAEARDWNVRFRDWLYAEDLSFTWRGSARVALRGDNGSGKSTLLRALRVPSLTTRGTLRTGGLVTLELDQRLGTLDDTRTVFDNVRAGSTLSDSDLRGGLARFLFPGEAAFQVVETLSGGERLRAALAQGFLRGARPELLVLDEPTNNLDLANIAFLESVVRAFRGAVVVVSHDEAFLGACRLTEEVWARAATSRSLP